MQNFIKETIAWIAIGSMGIGVIYFGMVCAAEGTSLIGTADRGMTQLLGAITSAKTSAAGTFSSFTQFDEMEQENKQLKQALTKANHALAHTKTMEEENARLATLLEMKEEQEALNMIGARVIGRNWDDLLDGVIIDVGRAQGVSLNDPVITEEGVVGAIGYVGETFSRVDTIFGEKTQIGGHCIESGDVGIVGKGVEDGGCTISYIPKESPIKEGDLIETSGLGGVFPKGLSIGRVASVGVEKDGLSKYATITPFATPKTLKTLCVIRTGQQ